MKKVITWNINYSDKTGNKYSAFAWSARKDLVLERLEQNIGDSVIYCLQEVSHDSRDDVCAFFEKNNYNFLVQQTHPAGRFVITAARSNLVVDESLTQLPGMRMSYLATHVEGMCVINMHLPMDKKFRLPMMQHVAEFVASLDCPALVVGDMNTFPDAGGFEQVFDFQNISGAHEASSVIVSASDRTRRVLTTFDPYPYDSVPDGVVPYHLDHVFSKNLKHSLVVCEDDLVIEFEKKKYGVSDHFLLKMEFQVLE